MSEGSRIEGCRLPEAVRRQYLDAMGITCWELQQPAPETAAQAAQTSLRQQAAAGPEPEAVTEAAVQPVADADWDSLQQQVAGCTRCAELCQSRTQTVFGTGDRAANVLIIGEAPGRDEDLRGEPFVGRAGQLLNAMLAAIGLEREQVYIANILKCRPPNNRDPSVEEAANCSGFLQQQIEMIQPRVIMVVGRIAAQNLLGSTEAIGRMRGRLYDHDGIPVIVTYHPAYLLRQPSEKRKSWQDLKRLKDML